MNIFVPEWQLTGFEMKRAFQEDVPENRTHRSTMLRPINDFIRRASISSSVCTQVIKLNEWTVGAMKNDQTEIRRNSFVQLTQANLTYVILGLMGLLL